jgi:hypothetical protein
MGFTDKLDILSHEPKLLIFGNDRYITKFGILMTILSIIAVGVIAGYFIVTFFQRRDINVIYSREVKDFSPKMDINDLFFLFALKDDTNNPMDKRYVEIKPMLFGYINATQHGDVMEMDKCTNLNIKKEYLDLFSYQDISDFDCIKPNKYDLTIYNDKSDSQFIGLYVKKCINTTENNNHCYPSEVIDKELKGRDFYFQFYFPSYNLDHESLDTPVPLSYYNADLLINSDFYFYYYNIYKSVIYKSDSALVFEDFNTTTKFAIDELSSRKEISSPTVDLSSYAAVTFQMNTAYADKYKRTYPKLQEVLANIGGILNLILTIAQVITTNVTTQRFYIHLSNIVINHEEEYKSPKTRVEQTTSNRELTSIGKNVVLKKPAFKSISFWEALLPTPCTKKTSSKRIMDKVEPIMREHMSCDYIIRLISEFEKFKRIMMNKNQSTLFDYVRNPTVDEHLNKMKEMEQFRKNIYEKDERIVKVSDHPDEITGRMLKFIT